MKPRRITAKPPPEPEATLAVQPLRCAGITGPLASVQACTGWTSSLHDEYRRSFVSYRKKAFTPSILQQWFDQLSQNILWNRPAIAKGKSKGEPKAGEATALLPRRACWLTPQSCKCQYEYSGTHWPPMEMPSWFLEITEKVSRACGLEIPPNSCNANYYVNGADSVGWHADDEPLFDAKARDALIISLSLGDSRTFELFPLDDPLKITKMVLEDGDLLTMEGLVQKHYKHRVPRERDSAGPRINLTWRWVRCHQQRCPMR